MPVYALGEDVPVLPENDRYWIAPDAQVIGKVRLGEDASIWFGAVLRGDIALIDIGAGSNIQDGCVCHTDADEPLAVGRNCTIGHKAILHACIIGDNSLVGMGATVLNRAVIGKNSLVGAHALVTEGKVFPDNSLIVGTPARVVRKLTDAEVERLRRSAERYVKNAQRFRQGLRAIG